MSVSYINEEAESAHTWDKPRYPNAKVKHKFPLEVYPEQLQGFIKAVATHTCTPEEMTAMMVLPAIVAPVQDKFVIRVRSGYREACAVQVLVGAETGVRKSPIESAIARPFVHWQQDQERICDLAMPAWEVDKQRADGAVKQAAKAEGDDGRQQEIEAKRVLVEIERRKPVARKILISGDLTLEGLITTMSENNGSLLILDSEGARYVQFLLGRWAGGQTQLEVHLKGFTGEHYSLTRRKEENRLSVPRVQLSQGVMAQPSVLQALYQAKPLRDMGFMGRQLVSHPDSFVGKRPPTTPRIPAAQEEYWSGLIRSLLRIGEQPEPSDSDVDIGAQEAPRASLTDIRVSEAGNVHLESLFVQIEALHGKGCKYAPLVDWTSKIISHATRIACALHIAEHPLDFDQREISGETTLGGCKLALWSLREFSHTVEVLGVDEDSVTDLDPVMHYIQRRQRAVPKAAQHKAIEISSYDVQRSKRSRWSKAGEVEPVLDLLAEYGWLHKLTAESTGGRPASPRYLVNPRLYREPFDT